MRPRDERTRITAAKVNPLGLVPTLRTDDGVVLTENAAILQYVAEHLPQAGLGARRAP